jgi:Uma2 family endonuclease
MVTTTTKLLTAEEFSRMPDPEDGSKQELVEGVIEMTPPPSFYHGLCCLEIGSLLKQYIRTHNLGYITSNDSGVILHRDPDTVRGPDLAFWSRERLPTIPREGYVEIVPDLVVEVLSPSDIFTKVLRKVQMYHDAGVQLVWVLVPEDRSVSVHLRGNAYRVLTEAETLSGADVLRGFTCTVRDLFP